MDTVGLPTNIFPGYCFGCFSHSFPVSCEDEPIPVSRPLFVTELPSSFQFTQSFTASYHAPKKPQQPPTVSCPLFVAEPGPLLLFPELGHSLPEQQPQTKRLVQQAAVSSHPGCRSPQPHAPNFRRLIDQFPFVFSFAEDLPNIFGNEENDDTDIQCF